MSEIAKIIDISPEAKKVAKKEMYDWWYSMNTKKRVELVRKHGLVTNGTTDFTKKYHNFGSSIIFRCFHQEHSNNLYNQFKLNRTYQSKVDNGKYLIVKKNKQTCWVKLCIGDKIQPFIYVNVKYNHLYPDRENN